MNQKTTLGLLLSGALWLFVGCSDDSTSEILTSTSVVVALPVDPQIQIGRETLLSLTKCQSDSRDANTAAEYKSSSRLEEIAEVCAEAKDQLGVEKELNPSFEVEIQNLMTELEFWTLQLEIVAFELDYGDGPITSLKVDENSITGEIDSFLELRN